MDYAQKNFGGPSLSATQAVENYPNTVSVNNQTSVTQLNEMASQYYSTLENYLNPTAQNLELCQNILSTPILPDVNNPGQASSYSGNMYTDNLGYLGNNVFPPVAYANERADELSNCAKDLPMFAASSLLPKASVNADNMALAQDAARALAAFTALSPVEQIGGITSIKTPYSKLTDIRALDPLNAPPIDVPFNQASTYLTTPFYGSVNAEGQNVPNGYSKMG